MTHGTIRYLSVFFARGAGWFLVTSNVYVAGKLVIGVKVGLKRTKQFADFIRLG